MEAITAEFPRNWDNKGTWSKESQEPECLERDEWGGGEEKEGLRQGEGNGAIFSSFYQTTASNLGLEI